jgi:hypothetical protein
MRSSTTGSKMATNNLLKSPDNNDLKFALVKDGGQRIARPACADVTVSMSTAIHQFHFGRELELVGI